MFKKTSDCSRRVFDALLKDIQSFECPNPSSNKALSLLARDFLRKMPGGDAKKRSQTTLESWRRSEAYCFATNQRLNGLSDFDPLAVFLRTVRSKIESVIGLTPPKGLLFAGRWSSGATFNNKRGTHFSVKMEAITCTSSVSYMLDAFAGISHELEIVRGNKACAVPKTADIDRMISIEPSGNAFLQQSVGSYIRKRLTRVGIDLNDQTPNQDGAFRAVVDDLSTLDLEAASDTISTSLVRAVLPHDWFLLLDSLRSHMTFLGGKWIYLDKFSSMGNGFTFELESLIFWAICKSCGCNRELLVYGDDLIIPRENADDVLAALALCGFKVNQTKSFVSGSYFESCGKHYFDLDDVTPVFQKEPITDIVSAFRAYNRLTRWGLRTGMWRVIRNARRIIMQEFPSPCAIPYGAARDDGYLVHPSVLKKDRNGDYRCKVLLSTAVIGGRYNEGNAYSYKLYNSSHSNETCEGYIEPVTGRTLIRGVRTTKIWASSLIT